MLYKLTFLFNFVYILKFVTVYWDLDTQIDGRIGLHLTLPHVI